MKRKDVQYMGIFTDYPLGGRLFREIENQHITLAFRPDEEKFKELLNYVGTKQAFEIKGYGNDGKNEGLLFKKGHIICKVPENEILTRLLKEIEEM